MTHRYLGATRWHTRTTREAECAERPSTGDAALASGSALLATGYPGLSDLLPVSNKECTAHLVKIDVATATEASTTAQLHVDWEARWIYCCQHWVFVGPRHHGSILNPPGPLSQHAAGNPLLR